MDSSGFEFDKLNPDVFEPISQGGATCDAFRVKLYGKLHFLKRLKPTYAGDVRYQQALQKEFETGYRLEHPNLVRYISFDEDGVLMEYIDGDTLADVLSHQPAYFWKRENQFRFIRQFLSAVQFLHEHQVLHLDLKPDNILLTHINHDVKLVDLGCCLTDTFSDTPGRTPDYAAPEQLQPSAPVDERTDIFAVGCILRAVNRVMPLPSYLQKVMRTCCREDPHERPASVSEIINVLERHERQQHLLRLAGRSFLLFLIAGAFSAMLYYKARRQPVIHDTIYVNAPEAGMVLRDTIYQAPPPSALELHRAACDREIKEGVDKSYQATIYSYNDSLFPTLYVSETDNWGDITDEFVRQVDELSERLAKQYPDLDPIEIRGKVRNRCEAYVTQVLDRMCKNRERYNSSKMEKMAEP